MQNLLLIYNPKAGDGSFVDNLDWFIQEFQSDYLINIISTNDLNPLEYFQRIDSSRIDIILIAGGDGTISWITSALLELQLIIPIYIIPTGTSNDFASYLNLSTDISEIKDIIDNNEIISVDAGKINDSYFINVCAGGFLTRVPHDTDITLKNRLGNIAYYLRGIQEIPNIKPLSLKIQTDEQVIEEKIFIFLILNSGRAGGFDNLSDYTDLSDGKFELVAIRYGNFYDMFNSLIDVFINKKFSANNIFHLQSSYYKIENLNENNSEGTDIDGEEGPDFPVEIEVIPKALRFFI
ncbi:MAG: YegS/Rv2252/BmrU family lipid kinase [Bacillota bacterium]